MFVLHYFNNSVFYFFQLLDSFVNLLLLNELLCLFYYCFHLFLFAISVRLDQL